MSIQVFCLTFNQIITIVFVVIINIIIMLLSCYISSSHILNISPFQIDGLQIFPPGMSFLNSEYLKACWKREGGEKTHL